MRISSLKLINFRSFGPEPQVMVFDSRLNTFIGLNSAGKTTALEALRKMFGKYGDQQFYKEDFHIADDEDSSTITGKDLSIEARIEFEKGDKAIASFFSDMVIDDIDSDPYIRLRLEAKWTRSAIDDQGDIDARLFFIGVPESEPEDAESKKEYPRHYRKLIEIFYVPAIRKPAEQLKYASGSILYRVLNNLKYSEKFREDFEKKSEDINELFKKVEGFENIQDTLQNLWEEFHKDSRYKEANLSFSNSDIESILNKIEIHFTPGPGGHRKFKVDDLGDGYRSLFYLTLVCALLELESENDLEDEIDELTRPLLTILAIEEPENHIAPQLLGRVIRILDDLADNENIQIFLTSHTPAIVKRIDPESLYHFRINEDGATEINQIELPDKESDAYKYVKEAVQNYPEIYFAKLVVIGEGDSEEVIFNRLMKTLDTDFDDNLITFAPLGHRFVNHIWELLSTLHIPYVTLLDLDLEREGGGWGRIKYALTQLIKVDIDKKELLAIKDGVLSDKDLEKMHLRDNSYSKRMPQWIRRLENYHVFFSAPLDIDLLMLESYPGYYTDEISYPDANGPNIPDEKKNEAKYEKYLTGAVQATLKSEDATGELYSTDQKKLMIWYRYHFLGRGKPVTHITVLPEISDKILKRNLPDVFTKIFKVIAEKLTSA
jgi:putative ATP-dependent endonuclease of the OLD family